MTDEQIKECPFCGSTDNRIHNHIVTNEWKIVGLEWFVQCLDCHIEGPSEDSREFATLAWNKGTPRHHRVHKLEAALKQIGESPWELTLPNYIAIRQIAREALE